MKNFHTTYITYDKKMMYNSMIEGGKQLPL